MRSLKYLKSLLTFAVIIVILFGAFYFINHYYKDELEKFYLKVDKIGITDVGKAEITRQRSIKNFKFNNLPLPFAQQEALINKTVFFGATSEMVLLALGNPASAPIVNDKGQEVWVYYFEDYNRPTYLYFQNKILVSAEKPGY